jgi:hypothetical protein
MNPDSAPDPQSLKQCLGQGDRTLGAALTRARWLADIGQSLVEWTQEPWIREIRIANIRDETVVVYATSAAALVPLRHRSPALLEWLKRRHRVICTRIDARVRLR